MSWKKKPLVPNQDNTDVFQAANELITRGKDVKQAAEGLTADGRRRWTRRPKALTRFDKFEVAAALRLKAQTWPQIAEVLGQSEVTVRSWVSDDRYQKVYADLLVAFKEEQRSLILSYVPDAIRTLHDLAMNDRSGHVRYEAAQALIVHAALDASVLGTSSDADFMDEINRLRKKAQGPNVQVNVGVMSQAPAQPSIEAEVHEIPT